MFSWIMRMPQDRWKLRRENEPCASRHLVVVQLHRVDGAAAESSSCA